jgi:hypothetical protein
MIQDLRHSFRAMARTKVGTAVILLSLALGTGVNATVSSAISRLLFRGPSGVAQPSRLVDVYTAEFSGLPYGPSSYPDFQSIQNAPSFAGLVAIDDNTIDNLRIGTSV